MHYLQPDYIFVSGGDTRRFWNVVFRWPQYHDLDHQAVIATIRMGKRRLTAYRRKCQKFPLQLPPQIPPLPKGKRSSRSPKPTAQDRRSVLAEVLVRRRRPLALSRRGRLSDSYRDVHGAPECTKHSVSSANPST